MVLLLLELFVLSAVCPGPPNLGGVCQFPTATKMPQPIRMSPPIQIPKILGGRARDSCRFMHGLTLASFTMRPHGVIYSIS